MSAIRMYRRTRSFRAAVLPAGVALTLLITGCSKSTPVAVPASTSAAPVASAPVSSAPASTAPVSSAPASSPAQSAPLSSAPGSTTPASAPASGPATSASPAPASGPASSPASSGELPVATVNTTDADAVKALSAMNAALLTAPEVGTGFTKSPPVAQDTNQKLPCGGSSASALYPNALRAELIAAKGDSVQFQESLRLDLDAATSIKAFDTTVAGLNCSKGSIAGTPVTIGAPHDVTASVGGSKAVAWEVTIAGASGVLVAVHSGSTSIGYTFLVATGTDAATLPNPLTVAKKATAKVIAGGLG